MKLVAVTRVLNEEDIIEPLIRHHAALVDHHIILDNGSDDRTISILHALIKEGMQLSLLQNVSVIFSETQFNTYLYRLAVDQLAADWVLFLDADEFIDQRGSESLRVFLASVPAEHASVGLDLINYDAPSQNTQYELNVVKKFVRRGRAPINAWKVFVRGDIGADRVTVDAGNHHMSIDGVYQPPMKQTDLRLAHYPTRSPFHWAGKAVTGRLKVLAAGQLELRQNRALHYVDFVELLQRDAHGWSRGTNAGFERLMTTDTLVDDPIAYLGGELKYTRPVDYGWRALSLTLSTMVKLATRFGEMLDAHEAVRDRIYVELHDVRLISGSISLPRRETDASEAARPALTRTETRQYQPAPLSELALEYKSPQAANGWPGRVPPPIPPLAFGEIGLDARASVPPADSGASQAFLLRGVVLHGDSGIMTVGDSVVSEQLATITLDTVPDASWTRDGRVQLPELPLSGNIHSGYHLLPRRLDSYRQWLVDAMSRFRPDVLAAFARDPDSSGAPTLLLPQLDVFWKWESLGLLVPPGTASFAVYPRGRVYVQRLLCVPPSAEGAIPLVLLDAFNRMREAVLCGVPARPWRRIYVARTDTDKRLLANEAALIARAEQAGFTAVVPSKLSVADQVRMFAEASHILAPHGAGLTNIGFCQPGAVLCELHMDSHIDWTYRRLAAQCGVRYGCLTGVAIGDALAPVDQRVWAMDLDELDAVLADPRFMTG